MSNDRSIWVLAGQSNMEGCGLRGKPVPIDPRVSSYLPEAGWQPAHDPLDAVHPAEGTEYRTGLGPAFGRAFADLSGGNVGLVPTAVGGTSLEQWNPKNRDNPESLYGRMLVRARGACERAGGQVAGVLWYQGESDAHELPRAKTYAERLTNFLRELRGDLGRADLPVVLVQIGRFVRSAERENDVDLHRGWDLVRMAIASVASADPHCALSSAIDLELSDNIHISTAGLHRLGRRLARLAGGLVLRKNVPRLGPQLVSATSEPFHPIMGLARLRFTGVEGGWNLPARISGFSACDAGGAPHPSHRVIEVTPVEGGDDLTVLLNFPIDATVHLAYAQGCNPVALLADKSDAPLGAFGPTGIAH
jgi:sialate O-acetylesterase